MATKTVRHCDPCLSIHREKDASVHCKECMESLCSECQEFHKRSKSSRNHRLVDLNELPSPSTMDVLQSNMSCPDHTAEAIVFFCEDHGKFCCAKCAFSKHRKCDNIQNVEDLADIETLSMDEDIKYKLESFRSHVVEASGSIDTKSKLVAEYTEHAEDKLKQVKEQLKNAYAILEWKIRTAIKERKNRLLSDIQQQRESLERVSKTIKENDRDYDTIIEYGKQAGRFVFKHRFERGICPQIEYAFHDIESYSEPRRFNVVKKVSIDSIVEQIKTSLEVLDGDDHIYQNDDPVRSTGPYTDRHVKFSKDVRAQSKQRERYALAFEGGNSSDTYYARQRWL